MKKIISVTISISKIINDLNDVFFRDKLSQRLSNLLESCVRVQDPSLLSQTNSLLEDLDYIIHSQLLPITPLLKTKREVMDFKLDLIRELKKFQKPQKNTEQQNITKPVPVIVKNKLSANQEKIVSFIKKSKKIRTKDIVEEFNTLSERTIKRTLKDLIEFKVLKKEEEDRAVYYSVLN